MKARSAILVILALPFISVAQLPEVNLGGGAGVNVNAGSAGSVSVGGNAGAGTGGVNAGASVNVNAAGQNVNVNINADVDISDLTGDNGGGGGGFSNDPVQIANAIDGLVPDPDLVFSDAVLETLSQVSLPGVISQRFIAFQGVSAANRDVGSRLLELRTGRYIGEYKQKRAGEFSANTEPESEETSGKVVLPIGDDRWVEIFAQGDVFDLEIDSFGFAQSLDVSTYVATAGIEYHPNYYQTLGFAASWIESDVELGRGLGGSELTGLALALYGSWYDGPLYIDGLVSYGWLDHDLSRQVPNGRTALADAESESWSAQLNTGYNFEAGRFVTGPFARVDYSQGEIEAYRERGGGLLNLEVDGQNYNSLLSQLGWQISMPVETRIGLLSPHIRGAWVHEYLNEAETVNATLVSFPANRLRSEIVSTTDDYAVIGAGLVLTRSDLFSLAADYEVWLGDDLFNQAGSLSLSIQF